MAQVYQPTTPHDNHVQNSAPSNRRLLWQPNLAIFSGSLEEQRARLEQAKAESVDQALRESSAFIDLPAIILSTPAPLQAASTPVQVSPSLPQPLATTAKKRSYFDLTCDDDDDEVTGSSVASPVAPQNELTRSPKRPLKEFQKAHSTPSWYETATSEAENSAVHPGDKPLNLEANGKHEKRITNARASCKALAKRRLTETAARNLAHEKGSKSTAVEVSVEEAERGSPSQASARNDSFDQEEVEAMLSVEDEGEGSEEEEPARNNPVYEEELEAILMEPEEEGILNQSSEVEHEQGQAESEFNVPSLAGELLDIWEEEQNAMF